MKQQSSLKAHFALSSCCTFCIMQRAREKSIMKILNKGNILNHLDLICHRWVFLKVRLVLKSSIVWLMVRTQPQQGGLEKVRQRSLRAPEGRFREILIPPHNLKANSLVQTAMKQNAPSLSQRTPPLKAFSLGFSLLCSHYFLCCWLFFYLTCSSSLSVSRLLVRTCVHHQHIPATCYLITRPRATLKTSLAEHQTWGEATKCALCNQSWQHNENLSNTGSVKNWYRVKQRHFLLSNGRKADKSNTVKELLNPRRSWERKSKIFKYLLILQQTFQAALFYLCFFSGLNTAAKNAQGETSPTRTSLSKTL